MSESKATATKTRAKTSTVPSTKAPTTETATKKPAASKRTASKKAGKISPEQRTHYVEVAAYFIAERRGFTPGDPLADWVAAENQVDQLINEGKLGA